MTLCSDNAEPLPPQSPLSDFWPNKSICCHTVLLRPPQPHSYSSLAGAKKGSSSPVQLRLLTLWHTSIVQLGSGASPSIFVSQGQMQKLCMTESERGAQDYSCSMNRSQWRDEVGVWGREGAAAGWSHPSNSEELFGFSENLEHKQLGLLQPLQAHNPTSMSLVYCVQPMIQMYGTDSFHEVLVKTSWENLWWQFWGFVCWPDVVLSLSNMFSVGYIKSSISFQLCTDATSCSL